MTPLTDAALPCRRMLGSGGKLLLLVTLLLLLAALGVRSLAERQLLEAMPAPRRATLLQAELLTFRLRCGEDVAHRSEADCRERARNVLSFPECGAACRQAVEAYAPAATR
ncbi:hypothetical protein FGE12_22785 [Aggregicoccus sp. 17bor-14]|uniref:hypothetical protein n=1 Tax=Myxococcaceae TaxID=31 RepID=UPI00129CCC49|nr:MULTISPECIES: hypothetical protein [Myxococcaceae]MBF5045249.1 hypothetical protein [Simulacricoccus sp. 17bor-14]MRI90990.1 hypothetical protein [Aggregicoccus sp. 17bor-14]